MNTEIKNFIMKTNPVNVNDKKTPITKFFKFKNSCKNQDSKTDAVKLVHYNLHICELLGD